MRLLSQEVVSVALPIPSSSSISVQVDSLHWVDGSEEVSMSGYDEELLDNHNKHSCTLTITSMNSTTSIPITDPHTASSHSTPFLSCDPEIFHGLLFYRHLVNETQTVRSKTGQVLLQRRCATNQTWVSVAQMGCNCPSVIDVWGIEWPQSHPNAMVTKPCPEGFTGTVIHWCSARCAWITLERSCVLNQCPEELAENVLWDQEAADGVQIKYCLNEKDIAFTRHCAMNGVWDPIEFHNCVCPEEDDSDGNHWPKGQSNQYTYLPCPAGYNGHILRRCDRFGRWMPPVFECSVHYCPAITIAGHEVKESLEGTHYTWPCSLPLSGYVRVHCLPGGNWSVVEDHCMPVNCDVFLSSDISIDTTHFVYNGGDNVTRMTVELFPQSNEELWNGEREARISHYNPLRFYDVVLKTYSMNDIEFVSNLCIVRSMQLTNICQTMAAPFLEKIKQDKKGGMIVFIGFVYPPCRTETLPDFNIHVTSMEECPSHTEFSLRFSCMTLVNECRANTVGHYTIRSGLRIDCSYSVSVELLTKGETGAFHHWSPPLFIKSSTPCIPWKPVLSVTAVSTKSIRLSWFIQTSDPFFFLQTVLVRKRHKSSLAELRSSPWRSSALSEVCSGEQSCLHMNSVLVPIDTMNTYHEIEMKFEAGFTMCDRVLSASTVYYSQPRPQVSLHYDVFDTYIVVIAENVTMVSQLTCILRNTLGEVVSSGILELQPHQPPTKYYVNRLNPNSRYMLQWSLSDIISSTLSNSLILSTTALRANKLVFSVIATAGNLATFEFKPFSEGMLVCLPGKKALSEKDGKLVQTKGLHMGVIRPDTLILKTIQLGSDDTVVSCLLMDRTESFSISTLESITVTRNDGNCLSYV